MFILAKVNYLRIYVCRVFKFIVLLMLFVGLVANAQDLQKLGKGKAFDKGGSIGVGMICLVKAPILAVVAFYKDGGSSGLSQKLSIEVK